MLENDYASVEHMTWVAKDMVTKSGKPVQLSLFGDCGTRITAIIVQLRMY